MNTGGFAAHHLYNIVFVTHCLNVVEEAMECTQNAGDVLYVPEGWGHGTENIGLTMGIALEFDGLELGDHSN